MKLEVYKDPGKIALDLIVTAFTNTPAEVIIVDANLPIDGHLGAWVPSTKSMLIDLGACIGNTGWMEKEGLLTIPNAWYNLLYTIYHEAAHARNTPDLIIDLDLKRDVLEEMAHAEAIDNMFEWLSVNPIPNLNDMGWMGIRLRAMMNMLYARNQEIGNEIDAMNTPAVARADVFVKSHAFSMPDVECLFNRIDDGSMGMVIGGVRYLRAEETFYADDCLES
jgi:hypothetical protein